jgi:hypothetical protein
MQVRACAGIAPDADFLQGPTNTSGDLTVLSGRTDIPTGFGTLCRASVFRGHFLTTIREFPPALEAMKKATGD